MLAPDDDKVRHPIRQNDDDERGERVRLGEQEMIGGNHNLLGVETELDRDALDDVNRSAVHFGLARLAQTPVTCGDAESFQQRFERRRTAVHLGSLNDFGNEKAWLSWHGIFSSANLRESSRMKKKISGD